jgi:nucleotide-binding universal stress UspA family protein
MPDLRFQSILFPVDFSESSTQTAPHVLGLANQTGASVTLLHVIPWLSAWYSAWDGESELRSASSGDEEMRSLEARQKAALEIFQQKYFPHVHCRLEVRSGAVAETITDTTEELDADLIMMPTRGVGRSRPFLIGSTTAKVLHDAHCAVWTSPHVNTIKEFAGYKNILCMVDQNDIPRGYLQEAARLAGYFQGRLTFVTAVPAIPAGNKHQVQDLAGVPDSSVVRLAGTVGEVVRQVTELVQTDLVLANRGHLQHPFGKFRTHAYEIVLESPCPVLSLCISSAQDSGDARETPETSARFSE